MTENPFLTGERVNFPPLSEGVFEEDENDDMSTSTLNLTIGAQSAYNNAEFDEEAFFKSRPPIYAKDTPQREKEDQEYFDNLSEQDNESSSKSRKGNTRIPSKVLYDPENDKVVTSGNMATRAIQTNLSINEGSVDEMSRNENTNSINEKDSQSVDEEEEDEETEVLEEEVVGEIEKENSMGTLFLEDEEDDDSDDEMEASDSEINATTDTEESQLQVEPTRYFQDTPIVVKKRLLPFSPVSCLRSPGKMVIPKTPDNRPSQHLQVNENGGPGMASPFLSPIVGQKNVHSRLDKSPIVPLIKVTDTLSKIDELDIQNSEEEDSDESGEEEEEEDEEDEEEEDDDDEQEGEDEELVEDVVDEENKSEIRKRSRKIQISVGGALIVQSAPGSIPPSPYITKKNKKMGNQGNSGSVSRIDHRNRSIDSPLGEEQDQLPKQQVKSVSSLQRKKSKKKKKKKKKNDISKSKSQSMKVPCQDESSIMRKLSYTQGKRMGSTESPKTPSSREEGKEGRVHHKIEEDDDDEFEHLLDRRIFSQDFEGEQRSVHPLRKSSRNGRPTESSSLMYRDGMVSVQGHPRSSQDQRRVRNVVHSSLLHGDEEDDENAENVHVSQSPSNLTSRTHNCPHCNSPFYVLYSPVPYSPSETIGSVPQTNRPQRKLLPQHHQQHPQHQLQHQQQQPVILQVVNPNQIFHPHPHINNSRPMMNIKSASTSRNGKIQENEREESNQQQQQQMKEKQSINNNVDIRRQKKKDELERKIYLKQQIYKKSLHEDTEEESNPIIEEERFVIRQPTHPDPKYYNHRYQPEYEDQRRRGRVIPRYYEKEYYMVERPRYSSRPFSDPQDRRRRKRIVLEEIEEEEDFNDQRRRTTYIPRQRRFVERSHQRVIEREKKGRLYHSQESYPLQTKVMREKKRLSGDIGEGYTTSSSSSRTTNPSTNAVSYRQRATTMFNSDNVRRGRRTGIPNSNNVTPPTVSRYSSRESMMDQLNSPLSRNNYNYLKQRYLAQLKFYESRNNKIFM